MTAGSLRLRLMLAAAAWIGAAAVLAGLVIAGLYSARVTRTAEEDLTHHLSELVGHTRVDAAGQARVVRGLSDPRFQQPGSGMAWQIDVAGRSPLLSASRRGVPLPSTVSGWTVQRFTTARLAGRPVRFRIREDGTLLQREINAMGIDLAISMAVLVALLVAGTALQLRIGLRPLVRLGEAVDALRRGRRGRLPQEVPAEFRPLVDKLNQLLEAQEVLVARGRREAGNLAHAIRTPLALVADEAEQLRAAGSHASADFLLGQCDVLGRQVDYHLQRAAAGGTGPASAPVHVQPAIGRICTALDRLYAERGVKVRVDVPPALMVTMDAGDLFEVLSNLLDNAYKWARGRIAVRALRRGGMVALEIADDGPGIEPARRQDVIRAGTRLDGSVPGSGLGLAVVHELMVLSGGSLELSASRQGGLLVTLLMHSPDATGPAA